MSPVFLVIDIYGAPELFSDSVRKDVSGWTLPSFLIFCFLMARRIYTLHTEKQSIRQDAERHLQARDNQIRELTAERDRLERQLEELRNMEASLTVFYRREFPMWWEEEHWHRFGVRNAGPAQAKDVKATLVSITPNPLDFNVLPAQLGLKDGSTDNCRINREVPVYFDLFSRKDPRMRTMSLWTVPNSGQHFWLDRTVSYEFRVEVSAENADTLQADFQVQYPEGGEVEVELQDPGWVVTGVLASGPQ